MLGFEPEKWNVARNRLAGPRVFFGFCVSAAFVDMKKTGGISNVCVAGVLLCEPEPQWIVSSVLVAFL